MVPPDHITAWGRIRADRSATRGALRAPSHVGALTLVTAHSVGILKSFRFSYYSITYALQLYMSTVKPL